MTELPPPLAYEVPPNRPTSAWGTVIGIISIVLASLSALSAFGTFANVFAMSIISQQSTVTARTTASGTAINSSPTTLPARTSVVSTTTFTTSGISISYAARMLVIVSEVITLLLAGLLLWAGISLLRRRPSGRLLHLRWAGLKIPAVVFGAIAQYVYTQEIFNTMLTSTPGLPQSTHSTFAIIATAASACFSLLYPVFLLITLTRPSVRQSINQVIGT